MSQLFKSFGKEGHRASAQSQLKSSVARGIRGGWRDMVVGPGHLLVLWSCF